MLSRYSINSKNSRRRGHSAGQRRRRRYSEGRLVLSSYALSVTLIVFLTILAGTYLFLINVRSTKGFEIKKLEQKITTLQKQQTELEQSAAELQSIKNLQEAGGLPDMVSITQVEYLENGDVAYDLTEGSTAQ